MEKQQTVYRIEDAPMDALKQYVEQQAGAEARQRIEETLESAHRLKQEYLKLAAISESYSEAAGLLEKKTGCHFRYQFNVEIGNEEKFRNITEDTVYREVERATCRCTVSTGKEGEDNSTPGRWLRLIRWKSCTAGMERNAWRLAATLCALERETAAAAVKYYITYLRDFSWDDIRDGNLKLETVNRSGKRMLYRKGHAEAIGMHSLNAVKRITERFLLEIGRAHV